MSALGDLPRLDLVIHADAGWERQATVEMRDWYTDWLRERDVEVAIIQTGDIRIQGAKEHIHIPFWTASGGPLRRQCTRYFKIAPIKRYLRQRLGYHPSLPPHPKSGSVEQWLGVTVDEWRRATPNWVQYIVHRWPLLELKLNRGDCAVWLQDHDLPVPVKSACIGCPYRSASEWLELREQSPEEWAEAVAFDRENRHNPLAARAGSTADELYIWRGLEALDKADLEAAAEREAFVRVGWNPDKRRGGCVLEGETWHDFPKEALSE
jgi:hypothetical protein